MSTIPKSDTHTELQKLIQESAQKALQETQSLLEAPAYQAISDDDAVAKVHAIVQYINGNPKSGRTLKQGVPILQQAIKYDNRNLANKAATFLVFNSEVIERAIGGTKEDVLALRDWFMGQ